MVTCPAYKPSYTMNVNEKLYQEEKRKQLVLAIFINSDVNGQ